MGEPITEKNLSYAPCVTIVAQDQAIWGNIKVPILEENTSDAPNVTTNAQQEILWKDLQGTKPFRYLDKFYDPAQSMA